MTDCPTCNGTGVVTGDYDPTVNAWHDGDCPDCLGWGGPTCVICRDPVLDDNRYCVGCREDGAADVWVTDRRSA